jgi:hypothetical protein
VRREVADAVLPRQERYSLTRAYDGPTYQVRSRNFGSVGICAAMQLAWCCLCSGSLWSCGALSGLPRCIHYMMGPHTRCAAGELLGLAAL